MSTYIGNTRWKKLKKLFIIAKGLIVTYGFKYFIYVVKLELKKQGFSLISPDETPVPLYRQSSFNENYQNFLQKLNKNFEIQSTQIFSHVPFIRILLFFNEKNSDALSKTLDSIIYQTYQKWEVILVSNDSDKIFSELLSKYSEAQKQKISFLTYDSNFFKKLSMSDGDYVGFLNIGTILSKFCLFEFCKTVNKNSSSKILYFDHDYLDEHGKHINPFFKPNWSPYLLTSMNYFAPFFIIQNNIINQLTFERIMKNCMDFDLLLQSTELTKDITHIQFPLCSITKPLSQNYNCLVKALENHFDRLKISTKINYDDKNKRLKINYNFTDKPKVSIIIPTQNNVKILKRCIDSIAKKTNYKNFEIIVVNNSDDLKTIKENIKSIDFNLISYTENFNFSKINNLAVKQASGELLLFLNDDTKVLDPFWLDELIGVILQNDIGVVGPKLVLSDGTIQHAGMAFLKTGSGFHPFMRQYENSNSYHNILNSIRDCSSVTGACLMIKKSIFDKIGGFDNQFDVYYGDADLCFSVIKAGYRVVYTPFTKLLHEGSLTIKKSNISHFDVENHLAFVQKWPKIKDSDPYYHPELDWDYSLPGQFN